MFSANRETAIPRVRREGKHSRKLIHRLARIDVLLVDELSYLNLRPEPTNIFFKLMEERYRRKPTILTTNLEYDQWHQLLGNKDLTEALLSRLRHQCQTSACGHTRRRTEISPSVWRTTRSLILTNHKSKCCAIHVKKSSRNSRRFATRTSQSGRPEGSTCFVPGSIISAIHVIDRYDEPLILESDSGR